MRAILGCWLNTVAQGDLPCHHSVAPEADLARWRLYRRLRPMFYGEHHLEEILWQERLSREVLRELLAAYEAYLVPIVCTDDNLLP